MGVVFSEEKAIIGDARLLFEMVSVSVQTFFFQKSKWVFTIVCFALQYDQIFLLSSLYSAVLGLYSVYIYSLVKISYIKVWQKRRLISSYFQFAQSQMSLNLKLF